MAKETEFAFEDRGIKTWFEFIERFLMVSALGAASKLVDSDLVNWLYIVSLVYLIGWITIGIRKFVDRNFPLEEVFGKTHRFGSALRLVVTIAGVLIATWISNRLILSMVTEFIPAVR